MVANLVDKILSKVSPIKASHMKFESVRAACGKVPDAVIVKARESASMPDESYRMAQEVFVLGLRQAAVARRVGVARQRVHKGCSELLITINHLMHHKGI